MIEGNRIAENRYLDVDRTRDPGHLRGQFVPWARLAIPEDSRAFKLTRGTLLVSSNQTAFLYDIETAELQQTIEVDTNGSGDVRCVDVTERHIFIVRPLRLSVYDRETGLLVLSVPAGRQPSDFYASPENQLIRTEKTLNHGELGFRVPGSGQVDRSEHFHAGACSVF